MCKQFIFDFHNPAFEKVPQIRRHIIHSIIRTSNESPDLYKIIIFGTLEPYLLVLIHRSLSPAAHIPQSTAT